MSVMSPRDDSVRKAPAAPGNVDRHCDLGRALARAGDHAAAIEEYSRAVALSPQCAIAFYFRGLSHNAAGSLDAARADWTRTVELVPAMRNAFYNRGLVYFRQGDLARAEADFSRAIELQRDYFHPYLGRGKVRLRQGDARGAARDLLMATRLDRSSAAAWSLLGQAFACRRSFHSALRCFNEAIALAPKGDHVLLANRGAVRARLGQIREALKDIDEAISLDPGHAQAYVNRASLKLRLGDVAGALKDCARAQELWPEYARAELVRGMAHKAGGGRSLAGMCFNQALALDPESRSARKELATLGQAEAPAAAGKGEQENAPRAETPAAATGRPVRPLIVLYEAEEEPPCSDAESVTWALFPPPEIPQIEDEAATGLVSETQEEGPQRVGRRRKNGQAPSDSMASIRRGLFPSSAVLEVEDEAGEWRADGVEAGMSQSVFIGQRDGVMSFAAASAAGESPHGSVPEMEGEAAIHDEASSDGNGTAEDRGGASGPVESGGDDFLLNEATNRSGDVIHPLVVEDVGVVGEAEAEVLDEVDVIDEVDVVEVLDDQVDVDPVAADAGTAGSGRVAAAVVLRLLLPAALIGCGVWAAVWLIQHRPVAAHVEVQPLPALVEVMTAESASRRVYVRAMGTVVPARVVWVQPELTGRIIEQSPELAPGGRFKAGDVMACLDRRDYELAVERQRALVERARLDLKVEEGRQAIARREWRQFTADGNRDDGDADLALRKPHMRNALAALAAAESGLKLAQLNLERTVIRAPFNCMVQEEFLDLGQVVTPASRIATLVGTEQFWVQVSVPMDRLDSISVPDVNATAGSHARVVHMTGGDSRIERRGRVVRLLADLEPLGRMARVLVAVDDPLGLRSGTGPPLRVGAYVRVEIEGAKLEGVCCIPRKALRDGERVWIVNGDDRLEVRPVKIAWRDRDSVLVQAGISGGERVIVSRVPVAIPNMKVRVAGAASEAHEVRAGVQPASRQGKSG